MKFRDVVKRCWRKWRY